MAEVSGRWVRQMQRATSEFRNRVIDDIKQLVTDTAELIYSHAVLNAPTAGARIPRVTTHLLSLVS